MNAKVKRILWVTGTLAAALAGIGVFVTPQKAEASNGVVNQYIAQYALAQAVKPVGGGGFTCSQLASCGSTDPSFDDISAKSITLSQTTGNNAVGVSTNGARIDFGAGASDYASSDGTTVTFAGALASASTVTATQYTASSSTMIASTAAAGARNVCFSASGACTNALGFNTSTSAWTLTGGSSLTISATTSIFNGRVDVDSNSSAFRLALYGSGTDIGGAFFKGASNAAGLGTCSGANEGQINYQRDVDVWATCDSSNWRYMPRQILPATGTLDFAAPAANACASDLTITVTGAADGDIVKLGVPNGSMVTGINYFAWVSASNTVSVRACCHNGGSACSDPASGTFRVAVEK